MFRNGQLFPTRFWCSSSFHACVVFAVYIRKNILRSRSTIRQHVRQSLQMYRGKFQFDFVKNFFINHKSKFYPFILKNAIKERFTKLKTNPKDHWLDYAENKHGAKLVAETKMVVNVLKLFLTLPLFHGLYAQSYSRWVFQADRMNGDLGFYTIKPDQMVMTMTLVIVTMIPTFDYIVYPILSKVGIKTQLHKIACGYICCALSFIVAAFIEWKIKDNYIHMLWLLPQYFIVAISDVFVWISTVNFAYTQAPERMKSVISSFVFLTVAGGSLIVIIVSATNFVKSQMYEFLMYSGLMLINTIVFIFMTRRFKFVDKI
jgi:dipeptide/tripeptide permease